MLNKQTLEMWIVMKKLYVWTDPNFFQMLAKNVKENTNGLIICG